MGSMLALACIAVSQSGGMESILSGIRSMPEYGEKTLSLFPDFSTFNADVLKMLVIFTLVWWSDANGYNMQRMAPAEMKRMQFGRPCFIRFFNHVAPGYGSSSDLCPS